MYLNKDRQKSREVLRQADSLGAKAIVFTVDVMQQTKRTLDVRTKTLSNPSPKAAKQPAPAGVSASISGYQDFGLTWGDIDFIRVSRQRASIRGPGNSDTRRRKTPSSRSSSRGSSRWRTSSSASSMVCKA